MKRINRLSFEILEKKRREKSQYKILKIPKKEVPFRIIQSGEIVGDTETMSYRNEYRDICVC